MSENKGYDGRHVKANHHERAPDGTPIYELRKPVTLLKNGRLLAGYLQINVAVWKALGGGLVAMVGFLIALTWLLNTFAQPPVRAIAKEEADVVSRQLAMYQEVNERHLDQLVADARATHEKFLPREEFIAVIMERQKKIDEMAAQIEFLYRNEIQKKQRGGG